MLYLLLFLLLTPESNLKESIEKSYYSFDSKEHLENIQNIEKSDINEFRKNYYLGIEYLVLGKAIYNEDNDKAYEYFNSAIDYLIEANDIKEDAEVMALLSDAYSKKASLSGVSAFIWGLKSKSWIYDANETDSKNRKVYLIGAQHLMHIPKEYGGDKRKSLTYLIRALNTEKKEKDWRINWATDAEIFAYIAQLKILENDIRGAKKYIKMAKIRVKDYDFVNIDLKKQLKKITDEVK